MEPRLGEAVIEEELCTNTAEDKLESCQAKECAAELGSPIAEVGLASEDKQLIGFDMLRFRDSFFEVTLTLFYYYKLQLLN